MSNRAALTETVLEACRCLGPARIVLRNGIGLMELFADLSRLRLEAGWANLVTESAHVHLTPQTFGAVAFRTVRGDDGHAAPSVWLYGCEGSPLLLLVLDQAVGAAADEQKAAYEQLRREYGPFMHLMSRDGDPSRVHAAPERSACRPLH